MRAAKALFERRRATEHLVATLSNIGVLVSRQSRSSAKRDWSEAAKLYQSIHPYPALRAVIRSSTNVRTKRRFALMRSPFSFEPPTDAESPGD
jgi:hypothetical protein